MEEKNLVNQPRNELVKAKHIRQRNLQIYLPLAIGILILAAFVLVLIFQQVGTPSKWADISSIFLIIPTMLVAALVLIIFLGLIFVFIKLFEVLPPLFFSVQQFFEQVEFQVKRYSKSLANPVIEIKSQAARFEKIINSFKSDKG